jgi:hypothetical protein
MPKKAKPNSLFSYIRIFFCILLVGITLYAYIAKQNEMTELRLAIPVLTREVKSIQEENNRLRYEIDHFESPIHLMELLRKPEFSHLKYPYDRDVWILPEQPPFRLGFSGELHEP